MIDYKPVSATGMGNKLDSHGSANTQEGFSTDMPGELHRKASDDSGSWPEAIQANIRLIEDNASKAIVRSQPIIKLNGQGVIWKRTINIIQGKFGSHKSRLAELLLSLLLSEGYCETDFCGFEKNQLILFLLAYVDTERNQSEQFPMAIQHIRRLAGLPPFESHDRLVPYSLIGFERQHRLKALKSFVEAAMQISSHHLFILLDVVTDCIGDFNNASESLELFDFLNRLINDHNITFLLIIHENPGTDKARGHTGTEASNKASTIMQIGFEKGANNKDSDLIAVKFLKLRNGKKPDPLYLYFEESTHSLARASQEMINGTMQERRKKADTGMIVDCLGELLVEPKKQKDLVHELSMQFEVHINTVKDRLKEIAEQRLVVYDGNGIACELTIEESAGKSTMYSLVPSQAWAA
ncbi:hypothetical protein DXT99_08265 [Pontibacter diazotrophicus]|uniref:AAA family ATPase n=1 Tax=Pontibacter diazotrophicus TaxID=1400979 RepID=A0A3D8LDL3_9BACT|nr:hypothetical protein [Pontibacter diazotrophicus]RDV15480.1 hypothetical protein DXT99_08265 [Pontibacter diazotrophicus]